MWRKQKRDLFQRNTQRSCLLPGASQFQAQFPLWLASQHLYLNLSPLEVFGPCNQQSFGWNPYSTHDLPEENTVEECSGHSGQGLAQGHDEFHA